VYPGGPADAMDSGEEPSPALACSAA